MEEESDLRVVKTKKALASALMLLLEEKSFSKITVNDICTEALVSRSAFYDHYASKYGLIESCIKAIKQDIFADAKCDDFRTYMKSILERIHDHKTALKHLFVADFDVELAEMLRSSFQHDYEVMLKDNKLGGSHLTIPSEIAAVYYAAGIASTILYWITRNKSYSPEEMSDYLYAMIPGC